MPLFDLTGKKAFVTGASRGIGQVIAVALAGAGADLALVARSEDGLADTAAQISVLGRKAFIIPADVTEQESVAAAVATAIDQLGCLDIVVNNAGGSSFMVPFLDLRLTGWDKLLRLNLDSAMYVCHAAGPHLVERGTGSVINVASVAGVSAAPFLAPYGAAKAAWQTYMAESRFSRSSLSQPVSRRSRNGTMKLDPPTLFTTMSRQPSWSIAVATAAATDPCSVASAGMTNPSGPARDLAGVSASPSSCGPPAPGRAAPATAAAITWPIPREAPVTKAFLPVRAKSGAVSPSTRWAAARLEG